MLALRDHGAELNPEEWLSLIRPVAGRGTAGGGGGKVFVDNAALAAMLATPAGGSFGEFSNSFHTDPDHPSIGTDASDAAMGAAMGAQEGDGFDWDSIAKASFRRILEKTKGKSDGDDFFELMDETGDVRRCGRRSLRRGRFRGAVPRRLRGGVSRRGRGRGRPVERDGVDGFGVGGGA
jgi:hypothetical protein